MSPPGQLDQPDHQVRGVHLVGSIRLPNGPDDGVSTPPSSKTVFKAMFEALPGRLRRIPDGETGNRDYFVGWQESVFMPSPWIFNDREQSRLSIHFSEDVANLGIDLEPTGYDKCAISSYNDFTELQEQGVIQPGVRFLVCIPTPINVLARFIRPEYQAKIEPMYEELLCKAIQNIQAHIPPQKLAIQFDCAVDFAILEGVTGPREIFKPWFNPSPQAIVDRILGLAREVHNETQLGFHFCYGDMAHKHFVEPKDTSKLVNMANMISKQVSRPVDFVHMPVPKDRKDDEYFAPLKQLQLSAKTEVYLGLVHAHDREGTRQRIEAARKFVQQFGVATECGWGRTPVQDVGSILEILKNVSGPV